jgi:hypothetical protein
VLDLSRKKKRKKRKKTKGDNTMTQEQFQNKFESWFALVTNFLKEHDQKYNQIRPIKKNEGKRYIKIVVGTSAWAFIDKENGDILKPASWAAPAKHARGNIFDDHNGMRYLTPYGPAYLR